MEGVPEQPPAPKPEAPKNIPKPDLAKPKGGVYSITEADGGFDITIPGLLDKEREAFVGTAKKHFSTREEAGQAVTNAQESNRVLLERTSLDKSFVGDFFGIDETEGGKFRVTLPGLHDSKTGFYIGTTYRDFDSWNQAKEYFLQQREQDEQLTDKPILEIQTADNERIAFSQWEAFKPRVAPSEKPLEIPPSVRKYLMDRGRLDGSDPSAKTYQETIKEPGWEGKLFSFVSSYLKGDGAEIANQLRIRHLDALTPKQSAELATRIVIDLTKYKWSDTRQEHSDLTSRQETKADQNTALDLLKEGLQRKDDPEWEGNGVCRNFASSVKAVFEAMKANQTRFSQLRNTYCLYEGGTDEFAPRRQRRNVTEIYKTGHAWNTFITVSKEGRANATIADVTWAKQNLDTKQIEGLDHTLTRMEPVVHAVGQEIKENSPDREGQVKHLLSYYALKIEGADQIHVDIPPVESLTEQQKAYCKKIALENFADKIDLSSLDEYQTINLGRSFIAEVERLKKQKRERQFFTTRAVELMKQQGVPNEIPEPLPAAIEQEYQELASDADISEIETLNKIYQNNPEFNFRPIFKKYLEEKQLSNHHAPSIIFRDDELQKMVFEEIKTHPDFERLMNESPRFRIRMREVLPRLFVGFSPTSKLEDALELEYLIDRSNLLRQSNFISRYSGKPADETRAKSFFENTRQTLQSINPQKFEEIAAGLDDYQLVKQYDILYGDLKQE
ncbi:MAG: hypothetical protein A2687_05065 [Candidatus Levybacteria bacterium RIFCSPHIGHO2_01_FULL_38_26]|nr:MAG: hypothetical protein A2687_05065 [Candidatus Levybacteria bacterium RIFCSPHIGHO2_01_FULL_38_26]